MALTRGKLRHILSLLEESRMKAVSRGLAEADPEVHEPIEAAITLIKREMEKCPTTSVTSRSR